MGGLTGKGGRVLADVATWGKTSQTVAGVRRLTDAIWVASKYVACVSAERMAGFTASAGKSATALASSAAQSLRKAAEEKGQSARQLAAEGAGRAKQAVVLGVRQGASRFQKYVAGSIQQGSGVAMVQVHQLLHKNSERITQTALSFAQRFSKYQPPNEQIQADVSPVKGDQLTKDDKQKRLQE